MLIFQGLREFQGVQSLKTPYFLGRVALRGLPLDFMMIVSLKVHCFDFFPRL